MTAGWIWTENVTAAQATVGAFDVAGSPGVFTLGGQDAGLARSTMFSAATGVFTLTGNDTTSIPTTVLVGETGVFEMAGQISFFQYDDIPPTDPAPFEETQWVLEVGDAEAGTVKEQQ